MFLIFCWYDKKKKWRDAVAVALSASLFPLFNHITFRYLLNEIGHEKPFSPSKLLLEYKYFWSARRICAGICIWGIRRTSIVNYDCMLNEMSVNTCGSHKKVIRFCSHSFLLYRCLHTTFSLSHWLTLNSVWFKSHLKIYQILSWSPLSMISSHSVFWFWYFA